MPVIAVILSAIFPGDIVGVMRAPSPEMKKFIVASMHNCCDEGRASRLFALLAIWPQFADSTIVHGYKESPRHDRSYKLIHRAAIMGDDRAIGILLLFSANVNSKDELGWTAMHHAARYGHLSTVKALVHNNASTKLLTDVWPERPDARGPIGIVAPALPAEPAKRPIDVAVEYHHDAVVEFLRSR